MKLKRKDVKVGELLRSVCNISLGTGVDIQYNCLYIVVNPTCWLVNNGIEVVCVATGMKFHANARYFLKTDNF